MEYLYLQMRYLIGAIYSKYSSIRHQIVYLDLSLFSFRIT